MSVLAALARAYERLPDAPPFGYSTEKIGIVVSLHDDGSVAHVARMGDGSGSKWVPRRLQVPQAVKRSSGIAPNFLWDKTSYVLGVTAGEGKRTAREHEAFVTRQAEALEGEEDAGLSALRKFLRAWKPTDFTAPLWSDDMKDQNVVFALESDRLKDVFIHDRPAAKALWARIAAAGEEVERVACLVTGEHALPARLHPSIKNVWGAQSSGASIVSFNQDAFASYGHTQGENAPVSEAAAFTYTTALNRFLDKGSGHRVQIGDASTVFWADAADASSAQDAENLFAAFVDETPQSADQRAAERVGLMLKRMRKGEPLASIAPQLDKGVRFHVLGLAPNAARISIRFYFEDDFGVLARNFAAYARDMALEPWPQERPLPGIAACALRTAPARHTEKGIRFDRDYISPLLSGELLRAILAGTRFPAALLALLLTRIRADHVLDSVRVAMTKALVVRAMRLDGRLPSDVNQHPQEDYLVRSDPNDPNPARRLGRLFAILERAQLAALGDNINATIKDKFLGAAAATPRQVFANLVTLSNHHTKRLRNGHSDAKWIDGPVQARRAGHALERDIGQLWGSFPDGVPAQHSPEEQGLFLVGYYQERFGPRHDAAGEEPDLEPDTATDHEDDDR